MATTKVEAALSVTSKDDSDEEFTAVKPAANDSSSLEDGKVKTAPATSKAASSDEDSDEDSEDDKPPQKKAKADTRQSSSDDSSDESDGEANKKALVEFQRKELLGRKIRLDVSVDMGPDGRVLHTPDSTFTGGFDWPPFWLSKQD
ncbi:unnamed protein product [Arabidopsis arenosa]|uniref:Uncharacterized protein n=1 Tax=Arabidopsis arenosa TaxID=38785 RepID=A0A8S1ZHA8_ARAAE|nr:unnamed protein product [Arabidopsis arenosa]